MTRESLEWVDTHGHLQMSSRAASDLVARAAAAGVAWVVCPGTDAPTSEEARRIAAIHPDRVLWSAGLHPHGADRWRDQADRIIELAADAAAIGECGLDFYRNLAPRDVQIAAFTDQVDLAVELDKPVIVHCRDAFAEVFGILAERDLGPAAVLHCWTGGPRWTKRFRELDVTFSFAGPITYDTGDTVRLGAAEAPSGRTMIETDTPFLTPPPHRRAENEPANVSHVGRALAGVWGVDVADVARSTTAVAHGVFGGPTRLRPAGGEPA